MHAVNSRDDHRYAAGRSEGQSRQLESSWIEWVLFKKLELWVVALLLLLMVPSTFLWGMLTTKYKLFPYSVLQEIAEFLAGDSMANNKRTARLAADLGEPDLFLRQLVRIDPTSYTALNLSNLNSRRSAPLLYVAGKQPAFRVLVGAMDFKDSLWGALLLDVHGKVLHTWNLSGGEKGNQETAKQLYGVTVTPDGSIIYTKQVEGAGVWKRDYCGTIVWGAMGEYHHAIAPDDGYRHVWTFGGNQNIPFPKLTKIAIADGAVVESIDMLDVMKANPDLYIFDHRPENKDLNMPHPNDIEVLTKKMAKHFPMFKAGDLLINYHMNGVFFVLDPRTLKVKFWYFGAGDGAHDPDFDPDGKITMFNNKYRASWYAGKDDYVTIVEIDPKTRTHRVLESGARFALTSQRNGRHHRRDRNHVMFDSADGRFLETDLRNGRITFDFINVFSASQQQSLYVAESFSLDENFFTFDVAKRSCYKPIADVSVH